MSEIDLIWNRHSEEKAAGRPTTLATLVRTRGSSYRRAGARALVLESGKLVGGISGGCLEQDVALRAKEVLEAGKPSLVHYDTGADDDRLFGLNIGCGGLLDVLVEPLEGPAAELLDRLQKLEKQRQKAALATVLSPKDRLGQRLLVNEQGKVEHSTITEPALAAAVEKAANDALARPATSPWQSLEQAKVELFLERIAPPQALVLFGSGFDVEPLALFGRALGFEVVVVDIRGSKESLESFESVSQTLAAKGAQAAIAELRHLLDHHVAALVMNHHYDHDRDLVRELLATKVGYLGLLGPRSRGQRLLGELQRQDGALEIHRVYSPVGLDLGADTPEKVALSILAEILAVLAGRSGGFLKDRQSPIHPV